MLEICADIKASHMYFLPFRFGIEHGIMLGRSKEGLCRLHVESADFHRRLRGNRSRELSLCKSKLGSRRALADSRGVAGTCFAGASTGR